MHGGGVLLGNRWLSPGDLERLRGAWLSGAEGVAMVARLWSMNPETLRALARRFGWGPRGAPVAPSLPRLPSRPLAEPERARIAAAHAAEVPPGLRVTLCPPGARGWPMMETWSQQRQNEWRRARARRGGGA